MRRIKEHEYTGTDKVSIQKRKKAGLPLTRKQLKAIRQRSTQTVKTAS